MIKIMIKIVKTNKSNLHYRCLKSKCYLTHVKRTQSKQVDEIGYILLDKTMN